MIRKKTLFLFLSVLPLILVLGACSSNTTPAPTVAPRTPTRVPVSTPTPPAGWSIHTRPGFQLALPSSWQELPLDDAALKSMIDSASNDNPHLAVLLSSILTSGQNKNLLFFAADKTAGPVVTNVTITRTDLSNYTGVDQAVRQYAQSLPDVIKGAKLISIDAPLDINAAKGGEIIYDLPLVNASGQVVTVRGIQYLVLTPSGQTYVVTVTGDSSDGDKLIPLARQIGRSFVETAR